MYYQAMKFLPDSAVLGTYKRLSHVGKPRRKKGKGKRVAQKADSRSTFVGGGDTRNFEQLLAEALRHAETKQMAGK